LDGADTRATAHLVVRFNAQTLQRGGRFIALLSSESAFFFSMDW